jgi:MFS family permease
MWKNRNLWILMSAEWIAGLGMWFGIIGNLEFLQHTVPSDFLKSVILMAGVLAGLLFGPYAGRVIDQSAKKRVLNYSSIARIVAVFFMFIAIETDSVWWMIGYSILTGTAMAFYFPALQSLIPQIVKEDELVSANGLYMNIVTIARVVGTAVAGLLVVYMSLFWLYAFTLIAYILIYLFTLSLRVDEKIAPREQTSTARKSGGFKEVLPIIKDSPFILMGLLLSLVPMLFLGGINLIIIEISDIQHDPGLKGWLYAVEGISFMIGAYLAKRFSVGRNLIALLLIATSMMAVSHLSLYWTEIVGLPLVAFSVFGIGMGMFAPLTTTLFQKQVDKQFHGRFFSFRGMFDRVLFQLMLLGTGLFLDTIGFYSMTLIFASCSILVVLYSLMRQVKSPLRFIDTMRAPQKLHG